MKKKIISVAAVCAATAAVIVALAPDHAPAQAKKPVPLALDGPAAQTPWKRYAGWPTRDMSKFNTLANLASPPAPKEPRKVSGPITGDAANGRALPSPLICRDRRSALRHAFA